MLLTLKKGELEEVKNLLLICLSILFGDFRPGNDRDGRQNCLFYELDGRIVV